MRIAILLIFLSFVCSCQKSVVNTSRENVLPATADVKIPQEVKPPTPEEPSYLGTTIDEVFPITANFSSIDDNSREKEMNVDAAGHVVNIRDYVPRSLKKDGRNVFDFKQRQPFGYWETLVGVSHLTGAGKTEIYTVVSGPGAVCCTSYSIVDVSGSNPKSVFHAEDSDQFRGPMEVFDAEGDGIYELVQFDSCFRYFMDDCGSCSPEPRAYFKYDPIRKKYLPEQGIQQDFVRDQMVRTEQWIEDKFQEFRRTGDLTAKMDLHRTVLSHVVELLHIGKEKKAWEILKAYDGSDGETLREMRKRLSQCNFYQAIRKLHA